MSLILIFPYIFDYRVCTKPGCKSIPALYTLYIARMQSFPEVLVFHKYMPAFALLDLIIRKDKLTRNSSGGRFYRQQLANMPKDLLSIMFDFVFADKTCIISPWTANTITYIEVISSKCFKENIYNSEMLYETTSELLKINTLSWDLSQIHLHLFKSHCLMPLIKQLPMWVKYLICYRC